MSEVSSSLPTEPALVYLSDPALPGYICVHLLSPHIRIVGVGIPPLPATASFQNPAPSRRFLRLCLIQIVEANTPTLADSIENLIPALVPTDVLSASEPSK